MILGNSGGAGAQASETIISIIGPGMEVTGNCVSPGTIRIEGCVRGDVQASKAVVMGPSAVVDGNVVTQDAVIAGRVTGSLRAGSRLEIKSTAQIDGEVHARRLQLDEGAVVNGTLTMSTAVTSDDQRGVENL